MNEFIKVILSRRSIRKYQNKNVPEEMVRQILTAGMAAPSTAGQAPWEFIVVTDEKKNRISEYHQYAAMTKDAPLCIVVCANLSKIKRDHLGWTQDCAAASQNMLLAAHALGLGAVWLGVYPVEERIEGTVKLFNIPENVIPVSIICIGYPAEVKPAKEEYKEDLVHKNTW